MKRLPLLILTLLLALFVLPRQALAHAHLIRADLAPNTHLRISVGTVRFWFDEPLNPALSRIVILSGQGRQVNDDTGELNSSNDEELDLTVPTLPDGVYSVRWTSASAQDGHVLHGFYLFTVGGPGAVAPPTTPAVIAGSASASLDLSGLVVALAHWLVLVASALWTGALALEELVLAPARPRMWVEHSHVPEVPDNREASPLWHLMSLATLASRRARPMIIFGLLATLLASVLELAAQAYASAGDWSGAVSTGVLSDVLNTQYGTFLQVRTVLVVLALLVTGGGSAMRRLVGMRRSAVTAWPIGFLTGRLLALLGLAYLLTLALSGHAGALQHLAVSSVLLDWLHLVAMAVWVGGMAAIAQLLVPLRDRRLEFLALLDRFSPAAYLALLTAAVTGMFNAQVRISSLDTLTGSLYGRLLLIKLALIAVIIVLSASHVLVTRPFLHGRLLEPLNHTTARATSSLATWLRLEPVLGALVLLCVALMGQVAPSASAFDAVVIQVVGDQGGAVSGGPITATNSLRSLAVNLRINPADIGQTQLAATVTEHGRTVTDGQIRLKLSMPANPDLGAAFVETTPNGGSSTGTGDLVQEGLWQADVLVRTRSDPGEFRSVPFLFIAGPEPALLSAPSTDSRYGPATMRLSSALGAAAELAVRLRPGLRVRYLITMQDMSPQTVDSRPAGVWYRGVVVPPMEGYMNLAVQVWEGGAWHTVRMTVCEVDSGYALHLLL